MYNEIKAVVTRIMDEFKNDVRLFGEILFEFNRLLNRQIDQRLETESVPPVASISRR